MNTFQVTFINQDGKQVAKTVEARHEFDAVQKAGAFNFIVLSVINLDL